MYNSLPGRESTGSAALKDGLICYDGKEVFSLKNIIPGSAKANIVLKSASLWSAALFHWS